ncbi:MAG: nuclear transport factor 2 family protein [Elusimicrobia bacterium]|nr:nuclear transport factor 2 family protein [Elusimicrobiota bacterium]
MILLLSILLRLVPCGYASAHEPASAHAASPKAAAAPCELRNLDAAERDLTLKDTAFPESGTPSREQAIAFVNSYFAAWNEAAERSRSIRPSPLTAADTDPVTAFHKENAETSLDDLAGRAPPHGPWSHGPHRTSFVKDSLTTLRGSVNKAVSLCVHGNKIRTAFRYYVPFIGLSYPLNRDNPDPDDVAVDSRMLGEYTVESRKIASAKLTCDFHRFGAGAARIDNSALVYAYVQAWNARSVDAVVATMKDDAVYEDPFSGPVRGKQAIRTYFSGLLKEFPSLKMSIQKYVPKASQCLSGEDKPGVLGMQYRSEITDSTGRNLNNEGLDCFTFSDGKIQSIRAY